MYSLGHPENTYILISLIFYTGLDLNPALLLYLHIYGRQMYNLLIIEIFNKN